MRKLAAAAAAMVTIFGSLVLGAGSASAATALPTSEDVSSWWCDSHYQHATGWTRSTTNLRNAPSTSGGVVAVLPAGTRVTISCLVQRGGDPGPGGEIRWWSVTVGDQLFNGSQPYGYIHLSQLDISVPLGQ